LPSNKKNPSAAGIRRLVSLQSLKQLSSIIKCEVDALGVITISRGCFERCCSNKKTPPNHSNLSFVTLRNRRPMRLRAPAHRTPSEASPRRRCGHASQFLWKDAKRTGFLYFVRRWSTAPRRYSPASTPFCWYLSHITRLTPQHQSAEPRNSAGAEALAVARRPKEASREKTRPPPVW